MASSPLHSLILLLARLALIRPVGRFVLEAILIGPLKIISPSAHKGIEGIQVIACGFPRSGTVSLMRALDLLGFKCYHGANLIHSDWGSGDKMEHCKLWLQAATEARWENLQQILEGYSAIADSPATLFWKQLMAAYPNAKIILNTRDPDRWYRSYFETVFWLHNKLTTQVFRSDNFRKLSKLMWQGKFKGKFEDKEFAVNVYKSHMEEVKRIVPKEKLLVYEIKEGWAPLCGFLQVDIPDVPFPLGNDAAFFRAGMKKLERLYVVFSAVYVGLLSCALAILLRWAFRFSVES